MDFRIGFAKDIHRLVNNRKLMIGGIHIPSLKGELAHSDGDVLLHAISEAMLGALALGDLGTFYPDNSEKYKNIDSKLILLDVYKKIKKLGYKIVNIDTSVELEKPKLNKYMSLIKKEISDTLKIKLDQISIKANTNEGLGDVGKSNAISATAIVLLKR